MTLLAGAGGPTSRCRAIGSRAARRAWLACAGWAAWCAVLGAAEPVPVMVQTAPGRVEIAAVDAAVAHVVASLAEETWQLLSGPCGLPAAFSSPVFVRLVPGVGARGEQPFTVDVAAGGVVSVRIQLPETGASLEARQVRQALVRGILLRHAVAMHGAPEAARLPSWLELGAAEWCETRARPAYLDQVKYETAPLTPPALGEVLDGRGRGAREEAIAALWLLTLLQSESTRGGEWPAFLRAVLGGEDSGTALANVYGAHFRDAAERELWWQTAWHHFRRIRSLPMLDAEETRVHLAALARFVFAPQERDVVVPLREVVEHGRDAVVVAELKRRSAELGRLAVSAHPFYRNAVLSLREAFDLVGGDATKRSAACAQFETDWREATELEAASRAALDRLEAQRR